MANIDEYKRYRETMRRLHRDMTETFLRRLDMQAGAKALGMWHKGVIVFGDESDTSILMDFILHECRPGKRRVIEEFRDKATPRDEIEEELLDGLVAARTSLFGMIGTHAETGAVLLADVFHKGRDIRLTDILLSQTAVPGNLLFSRVVECQDLAMTTGVSFPFDGDDCNYLISRYRKVARTKDARLRARKRYLLFYTLSKHIGIEYRYE